MNNFENIIKLSQMSAKPFGINSYMANLIETQNKISKSFGSLNRLSELAYNLNTNSALQQISKSIAFQSQLSIPQSAVDVFGSIYKQNEQIAGTMKAVAQALKIHLPTVTEINNLHFAVSEISKQIALVAVKSQDWTILNDFEEVTEQTLEFTENLTEGLDEEQQIKFQVLLTTVLSFLSKHKTLGVSALLIVDIFLRFAGIHQYYDFMKDKPAFAEKSQINKVNIKQDSIIHFIQEINKQIKKKNEYRITNRICQVKLKPNTKTITIAKLPVNFQVIVLQINHKWLLISYTDASDNLPQTGWVMKKYLKCAK